MTGFLEGFIDSWSDRQLTVVGDRLMHAKVRKGTRHWEGEPGTKALDTSYVVTEDWVGELSDSVEKYLKSALTNAAYAEVNRLKDNGISAHINQDDIDAIVTKVWTRVEGAALNQGDLVAKHIGVLDADSKSLQEIKDTLTPDAFDRPRWSMKMAQWITTYALEALYDNIYSNVSGKAFKIWNTGADEQFRPGHADLDGKMLSVDSMFEVGEVKMAHPARVTGIESDHCSCWLYYGVDV
jgi:hypothetical protein